MNDLYRSLPAVVALREKVLHEFPHGVAVAAARQVLGEARQLIRDGGHPGDVHRQALERAQLLSRGRMRPVINATGVVVHTNLGRSAWSPAARAAAVDAMGYCNVEMELGSGRRGGRLDGVAKLVNALCGAEAAIVVNNCASAVLLALTALARDREVIVSRGELVEIGGSFRVPDVIASGGARLVEVGTTNRTRAADYAAAITPETGALLSVHPSNFRLLGFTEAPSRAELVAVGRAAGVPVLEDLGSGSWEAHDGEPGIRPAIAAGVDLVMFSGDKLLGGPQAGIIVGRADVVATLRKHPLYRALRVDKVILAALEGTLAAHLAGEGIPTVDRLKADLEERTRGFAARLRDAGLEVSVHAVEGRAGGGALPERPLPSHAVRIEGFKDAHARALRTGEPSVVGRMADGAFWLDLRCVEPDREEVLFERVRSVHRGTVAGVDPRDKGR